MMEKLNSFIPKPATMIPKFKNEQKVQPAEGNQTARSNKHFILT